MKRSIAFFLTAGILMMWFASALDNLIRYNLNWIDYIKYSFNLTSAEEKYFETTKVTCGVEHDEMPLAYITDEQQIAGIFVDFISQISIELENSMEIQLEEREKMESDLENHRIETAIMEKTREREKKFLFTEPIYIMHGKMLVKEDSPFSNINQIENVSIAVLKNDRDIAERLIKLYGSKQIKIIFAESIKDALKMLELNQVAAVAGDETKLSYYLNRQINDQYYRFLEYSFSRKEICMAFSDDNKELSVPFNKAILSMKENNLITKTQSKWFGVLKPETVDMKQVDNFYNIVFIFIVGALLFTVWNILTARKVTEKTIELQTSREQLRLIIDTLDSGLIIANSHGKVEQVNHELCRIAGTEEQQILNTDINRNPLISHFINEEDEKVFKWDNRYYMKKNIDFNNEHKRLYIIEECTERYINQRRNMQEEKMIAVGQLSAGLAHEIRNPLGLIKSYMYLIKGYCKGENGEHAVYVINDSINRINNLIESLLGFSRLSGDEYRKTDINEIINSILLLEKKRLEKNEIQVSFILSDDNKSETFLNADLLKMTLINLLNNCIDAFDGIERQKNVSIDAKILEQTLYIEFKDNGCGIKEEKLRDIFNPFFSSKEQGTGLGLYIVSTQLEKAGGTIRAESKEGEYTTFYIEIPLRRENVE